jgi:hypothetical protein
LFSPRKGLGLALVSALAALATSVPVASATVTQSTAATSPSFAFEDATLAGPSTRHVTGTTDGTTGDNVDVVCLNLLSGNRVKTNVAVAADGSVSVDVLESDISSRYCHLGIVPAGTSPVDASAFSGPWVGGGLWRTFDDGGVYDFYTEQAHAKAYVDMHSIGYGGLYDMLLYDASGNAGDYLFYDNAYLDTGYHGDGAGGTRPDALVDGQPAFASYNAYSANSSASRPGASFTHTVNPDNGDVVITDDEDLLLCADGPCSSFVPSGLRVERTIVQDHDGRMVSIYDEVRNTSGASHSFDFEYEQYQYGSGHNGFRFPGQSDYANHVNGDVVNSGFGDVSTIGFEYDTTAGSNGTINPLGTLTVSPKPTRALFGSTDGFWLGFAGTVPAGGTKTIRQVFSMGASQAEVDGYAAEAEGGLTDALTGPSVAINDPAADGATVNTQTINVKGTASDNKGVASLKVNGSAVSVAGDGTWSAPVTLTEGSNTITAVVKDAAGNEATAARTVTYAKPAAPPPPAPPAFATVSKSGKVKVTRKGKKILVDTGIKVGCPAGNAACSAAVDAKTVKAVAAMLKKRKLTVAKKTFTVAAGKTQKVVLTLSAKGAKALKRNKKLVIKVTVVAKVGSGAARTTTRTITVRQPKKR